MIRHIRILIVDDDTPLVERLESHLRKRGYTVETRPTPEEAASALKSGRFELLVCRAPERAENGTGIISQAKAIHPEMGILVMAEKSAGRAISPAQKSAIDEIVRKPFSLSSFFTALERAYWRSLSRQEPEENS